MFDRAGVGLIKQSMNAQSVRQKTIAQNVANLHTPGYTAKRVKFEEILAKTRNRAKLRQTNTKHLPTGIGEVQPKTVDTGREVILDEEMGQMAKVQILYAMDSLNMSKRFGLLREAISGQVKG
jgi:flagellar basal-body rod protein FlgB